MTPKKRISLSLKLNFLIVVIILLLSAGLVYIFYNIYSDKIFNIYMRQGERAVRAACEMISADIVENVRNEIMSDEFRNIRAEALAADDENIIRDWMRTRPSFFDTFGVFEYPEEISDRPVTEEQNLYTDYGYLLTWLNETIHLFDIKIAYIQFFDGNRIINLADLSEDLFNIGTIFETNDEFEEFKDFEYLPSTIYQSKEGWVCSAYHILEKTASGSAPGFVGVDIEMDTIMLSQRTFLVNSALYVIAFTVVAILISMISMNRTAIRPLLQLAGAARSFAKDDNMLTKDDIIQLPIRSNDEIGDLYYQIQSMQTRILDYIDHIKHVTVEKERADAELHMAAKIQKSMLPAQFPAFPDRSEFDLYASMTPAREVGGDFYDFFLIDDDHLAVLIADVSDKGIPAVLFMMYTMNMINYRARQGGTPGEIITDVNAHICKKNKSKMFVTVWMGIQDLCTGIMTCSNAGHEFPFIRSKGKDFKVIRDQHGLVIGALPKSKYRDYELMLEPGDAVFVYTDGVTEACSDTEEFYGMKRLEKALNRAPDESPRTILEAVKTDVDAFVNGADQFDDLTMLCIEYKGSSSL